ncbi:MAG: HEAT repeat domain-containing protein [Planctomycetota bacterium]
MNRTGSMSVGLVVAMVALLFVYQKLVVTDSEGDSGLKETVAALDSEVEAERTRAHEVLLDSGPESLDALLVALNRPGVRRPEEIIRILSDLGEEKAIASLREVLTSHPDALARRCAATALGEMPDHDSAPLLKKVIDSDASLQVRQAALLAVADMGDDTLLRDLAALLDPSTVKELRASAASTLEVLTDQLFGEDGQDRDAAEAWLDEMKVGSAVTEVGGAGRVDGEPLEVPGQTAVLVERDGDRVRFALTGRLDLPMNLLLEMEKGRILVELIEEDGVVVARATDAPGTGRPLARHAPVPLEQGEDALRFSLPRVGRLVSPLLPRSAMVISPDR